MVLNYITLENVDIATYNTTSKAKPILTYEKFSIALFWEWKLILLKIVKPPMYGQLDNIFLLSFL